MSGTIMNNINDVFEGLKSAQIIVAITCFSLGITLYAIPQYLDMSLFFKGMTLLTSAGMVGISLACMYELYHL
tara:strand:- start:797 stop:1015 length:219 start_codon:yes stop_codon:yes gene_type:complete